MLKMSKRIYRMKCGCECYEGEDGKLQYKWCEEHKSTKPKFGYATTTEPGTHEYFEEIPVTIKEKIKEWLTAHKVYLCASCGRPMMNKDSKEVEHRILGTVKICKKCYNDIHNTKKSSRKRGRKEEKRTQETDKGHKGMYNYIRVVGPVDDFGGLYRLTLARFSEDGNIYLSPDGERTINDCNRVEHPIIISADVLPVLAKQLSNMDYPLKPRCSTFV